MKPELTVIVAMGRNREIGRRGDLAFHISADLRRFKALTMGGTLIMGRKTFESLPNGPLPGRRNIVVTRNPDWAATQPYAVETAGSLADAIALAMQESTDVPSARSSETPAGTFIIGGGEIYAQALPLATKLELTQIDADLPDADTFFPEIGPEWTVTASAGPETDPRTALTYRFLTLSKIPPQKPQ